MHVKGIGEIGSALVQVALDEWRTAIDDQRGRYSSSRSLQKSLETTTQRVVVVCSCCHAIWYHRSCLPSRIKVLSIYRSTRSLSLSLSLSVSLCLSVCLSVFVLSDVIILSSDAVLLRASFKCRVRTRRVLEDWDPQTFEISAVDV